MSFYCRSANIMVYKCKKWKILDTLHNDNVLKIRQLLF